jgi:hypothetical protein
MPYLAGLVTGVLLTILVVFLVDTFTEGARKIVNWDVAAQRLRLVREEVREDVHEARAKQPYAIAMKDGSPFGLAGLWENWRNPTTGEWERTFAIITVSSNELVAKIHNRMPAILKPESYDRWLSVEPDPHDLLITYPSEPMSMWPISTRVNKPENDDPHFWIASPKHPTGGLPLIRRPHLGALYDTGPRDSLTPREAGGDSKGFPSGGRTPNQKSLPAPIKDRLRNACTLQG